MAKDKINIIVTGAGKGIGFELVKYFALTGNRQITAISRNTGKLNEFIINKEVHPDSIVIPLNFDLESDNFENDLLPLIRKTADRIDILINNAGLLINKPFIQQSDNDFDKQFNVNIKAAFRLIKILYPFFNKDAHIVNISSMGGFQGSQKYSGLSLYSASKAALAVFTECIAVELSNRGIRANCLALGATQTEMLEKAFPGYKAPVSAEKMAEFIAGFALNSSQFINGKVIPVSLTAP
jgi:NAD(P)-dependent dehydrogenase (short-subunit alcohol dehydrogenase family)